MDSSADEKVILPKAQPFAFDEMVTSHLQLLASAYGNRFAWGPDRADVLAVVSDEMLNAGPKVLVVENAKVVYKPGIWRDFKPNQAHMQRQYSFAPRNISVDLTGHSS